MRTVEIHCDKCGVDVGTTGNCVDYRIVLASERKPSCGGVVTLVAIPDPIPQTRHFCGTVCLAMWVRDEYPNAEEMWVRQEKHREWLRKQHESASNPPVNFPA